MEEKRTLTLQSLPFQNQWRNHPYISTVSKESNLEKIVGSGTIPTSFLPKLFETGIFWYILFSLGQHEPTCCYAQKPERQKLTLEVEFQP